MPLPVRQGLLLALALLGCSQPQGDPSLLLIVADSLRADVLSCYGGEARTPNLCALAERGALFERAYSNAPWTPPSTVSMLTGTYASAYTESPFGAPARFYHVGEERVVLAEVLRERGYDVRSWYENDLAARTNSFQGLERITAKGKRVVGDFVIERDDRRHRRLAGPLRLLFEDEARPFFLLAWMLDPHAPYGPPRAALAELEAAGPELPHPLPYYAELGHQREASIDKRAPAMEPVEVAALRRLYAAEVESVDERVGYLFEALESEGLWETTFVVFTSDHGEGFGEHGHFTHGKGFYDEFVRVPLVVAGPGIPPGRRVREPVALIDLTPTLAELLGAPALGDIQGASFAGLLYEGSPGHTARAVYLGNPTRPRDSTDALLDGSWKLFASPGDGFRLYDLARDPGETRDVAAEHPAVVARMAAELASVRAENEARRHRELARREHDEMEDADAETLEALRALGYVAPEGEELE